MNFSLPKIWQEISARGTISIRTLAKSTGLQASALDRGICALKDRGLVCIPARGSKIAVNPAYAYVVGIDLGASHLHFALADFCGKMQTDSTLKIVPENGPRKLISQIQAGIHALAAQTRSQRLAAIAIAVPSAVDPQTGAVSYANNLPGWKNIHLGRAVEREFRVPLVLENDANMAAIGERWRGVAKGVDNFAFIALGTGIGSGIFVNGSLLRGRIGWAGELFKLNIEWQRWDEDFPETGYLESYVSGMGIAAQGHQAMQPAAARTGNGIAGPAGLAQARDARFVFDAARQGNREVQAVLEKTFTMMGVAAANYVAILDPDLIVFGGGVSKGAPDLLLSIVRKVVERVRPDPPRIELSALEDKAQTYGGIYSALTLAYDAAARNFKKP
jgi:predicted NBD/HSP70 family sugar kinase